MRSLMSTSSSGFAFKASFVVLFFNATLCRRVLLLDINYSERCIFGAASILRLEAGSVPY